MVPIGGKVFMKLLRWCEKCQLPLIGEKCDICGRAGNIIKPDIRPIFIQEKQMLEREFNCKLPFPLYYGASGWLYAMGGVIGRMSIKESRPSFSPTDFYKKTIKETHEMTIDEFKQKVVTANISSLSVQESEAIIFIKNIIKQFSDYKPVVAFSGGKDSTVSAALVQHAIGRATLFFGDTTIEFPDTYQYLNDFSKSDNYKIITQRPAKDFYKSAEELGPPSQSLRWCCTVVKASPLNSFLAQSPDHRLFFDGIRRRESHAREDYERVSGNKKSVNQIVARPILDWTTIDVWLYIWWRELEYNSLYDKGYGRAGCMHCPNNTKYDAYLTSIHFPEQQSRWASVLENFCVSQNSDIRISQKEKDFWVDYGWKHRLPHRGKNFVGKRCNWHTDRSEIVFDRPINANLVDFLVPTGNALVSNKDFILVTSDSTRLEGKIGNKKIRIKGSISRQIIKAINKYLNCFGCGACVGSCPVGAISMAEGKLKIDMEKCTKCESCLGSSFLGSGCVSLTYKSICNALLDINEVTGPVPQVHQ